MQSKPRKRPGIIAWTLGISVIVVGSFCLYLAHLASIQMVPVSAQEVREISGSDLMWNPEVTSLPTISVNEIGAVSEGKQLPTFPLERTDEDLIKNAHEIVASRMVTDRAERLIAGKAPLPPSVDSSQYAVDPGIERDYRFQFALDLARNNLDAAIDRVRKYEEFCSFIDRYDGDWLAPGAYLHGIASLIATKHSFSEAQLRVLYSIVKPAETSDSELPHRLRFEFQSLCSAVRRVSPEDVNSFVEPWDIAAAAGVGTPAEREDEYKKRVAGQFDGPQTVRELAALYREAIANSKLPWLDQRWPQSESMSIRLGNVPGIPEISDTDPIWKQWWTLQRYRLSMNATPNVLGLSLIRAVGAGQGKSPLVENSFRFRTEREAARLQIALELYRKSFGHLPALLADLKKLHLPGTAPVDLYCNGPFHYDSKRRLFWSVGENGRDDAGLRRGSGDDIATTIP